RFLAPEYPQHPNHRCHFMMLRVRSVLQIAQQGGWCTRRTAPVALRSFAALPKPQRDPERPLKPATPWLLFLQDFRADATTRNTLKAKEVMTAAAKKWREMPSPDKEKYEAPAKVAKEKYDEAMKAYVDSGKKDAWKRDPERPKRPLTPWMNFIQEHRQSASGSVTEVVKSGAAKWKNLSDIEKKGYEVGYAEAKEKYAQAMKAYKDSGKAAAWEEKVGIAKVKAKKTSKDLKAKEKKMKAKEQAKLKKEKDKGKAAKAKAVAKAKKAKEAEKEKLKGARRRASLRAGELQVSGRYHHLPRKLSDDYDLSDTVLGSGFSGNVLLATSKRQRSGRFAVKSIKLYSKETRRTLAAEVEVFLSVDHPHVCRLFDVYEDVDHLDLVMECLEGGELLQRVNAGRFAEKDAADAAYQMLLAIRYLHSLGVVHRDIKLENFMYDEKGSNHLKLIDFGFSKAWDPEKNKKLKMNCGTICYVAPEVIQQSYTNMCDLWSLGVVVFLLLVGYMPFPIRPDLEDTETDILNGDFTYDEKKWSKVSASSFDFVSKLLQRDPEQRMTAEQALAHPWIRDREQMPSGTDSSGLDASVVHSLAAYARASKFRRTCLQVMAWSLSNSEMAEVREAFMELDQDKKGTIQLHELRTVLEDRFDITDEETRKIFAALDASNHEEVKYSEFLAAMMSSRIEIHEDLVRTAFKRFDTDPEKTGPADPPGHPLKDEVYGYNML
ncbi:unnamed protein product, partial [Cladocopium goreaui]